MKRSTFLRLTVLAPLGAKVASISSAQAEPSPVSNLPQAAGITDQSLQNQIRASLEKGYDFLQSKQDPNGAWWSSSEHPGITALVLTSLVNEPTGAYKAKMPAFIQQGYDYLAGCAKPDGGIYSKGEASYNTAVCLLAIVAADTGKYGTLIQNARSFLISQQGRFPRTDGKDSPYEGGIGYGEHSDFRDLSNTTFALEALRKTQSLSADAKDLDWSAAQAFIQRCQNHPQFNHQSWVSNDPQNLGGFVYEPQNKKALHSYGSMSYAGLLSYIYADLKKDDPRVTAVHDWLSQNYTIDQNPGMGEQGLYYYYHMMAKALNTYGVNDLSLASGKKVNWRHDLAKKLISLQQEGGFWANTNGRWWEKDPVLVTAYATLTLEMIYATS